MLGTFRSISGKLGAKILLGFLIVVFGVWGIGDMLRNPTRNFTVATVGSATVSGEELARALYRETENMKRVLGEHYSPELLKSLNIPHQVLQKQINRALLRLETESLGLVPGDADVVRRIRANPAFQDKDGNFDKAIFEATLKNGNLSEKSYVEQLRGDMAINLLVETLLTATPVSDTAVRALLAVQEERRAVTLYNLTPSLISNVPQPDEAQIKAYYSSHSRDFTAPEYRKLSYVTIAASDVHEDAVVSEEELKNAYKDRIDEFKRPERRTVEQLLYSSENDAKDAENMLKNGEKIEKIAQKTPVLNKNSLSLGKIERGSVPGNAGDAVFSLHIGENTPPIESPFGWHIFHVSAVDEPSVASFEEMHPLLEKDLKQRGNDGALNKLANKFEDALAGGGTLQEAAKDLGLKVISLGPVNRQGESPDGKKLKELPDLDKFLETAFKTEEKTESPLVTAKGGLYYIVHTDGITPERLRPLDEVKAQVISGWQKEERAQRLAKLAQDIAAKFADAGGRDEIIAKYNLKPAASPTLRRDDKTAGNIALPPQMVADVFAHKPGHGTGAYPAQEGNYLIAVVDTIIPAPSPDKNAALKDELEESRHSLENNVQNEIIEQYTRYLAEKYPVSVNETALQAVVK